MRRHLSFCILLLLGFLAIKANAQKMGILQFDLLTQLNTSTVSDTSNAHKILAVLASNNVTNIESIKIDYEILLNVRIEKQTTGELILHLTANEVGLAKTQLFRGFSIGAYLLPDEISVTISIPGYTKHPQTARLIRQNNNSYKGISRLSFTGILPDSMQLEFRNTHVFFSKKGLKYFMDKTMQINYYYAYTHLLSKIISETERGGRSQGEGSVVLFVNYQELSRINAYLNGHQFESALNLTNADPQNFRKLQKKYLRLLRRAETLFQQELQAENTHHTDDALKYAAALANLSEKYIRLSRGLQPYLASAYIQMVNFKEGSEEFSHIEQVSVYYGPNKNTQTPSSIHGVYSEFVQLADSLSARDQFSEALLLLKNARLLDDFSEELDQGDRYTSTYIRTLDGLMSSYLKVAHMAYKSGNKQMADNYIEKAAMEYEKNKTFIIGNKLSDQGFSKLFEAHIMLAFQRSDHEEFENALSHLNSLKDICKIRKEPAVCTRLDSAYYVVYASFTNWLLSNVETNLLKHKLEAAHYELLKSHTLAANDPSLFLAKNSVMDRMQSLAYAIYLEYLQIGEISLDQKRYKEAVHSFYQARKLESIQIVAAVPRLQDMLAKAILPQLFETINQASLDAWANRLVEATKKYDEVRKQQQTYQLENHTDLNTKLDILETKIRNRSCLDVEYRFEAQILQIQNRVNSGAINQAMQIMDSARRLAQENPFCKIDTAKLQHFSQLYAYLFEFNIRYEDLKTVLYTQSYTNLIPEYQELMHFYQNHHLRRFGIQLASFNEFVKTQHLVSLTMATVEYYLARDQYHLAFEYLQILKEQGVSAKATKGVQMQLGKALAMVDQLSQDERAIYVNEYTAGDAWYKSFTLSYLK